MDGGQIIRSYHRARRRLFLLDYDGVLAPIVERPELAKPSGTVLQLLRTLGEDPRNTCVIISGRKHEELEQWFGSLPLSFVAEHGLWQKGAGDWSLLSNVDVSWKPTARKLMEAYVLRLPGAFIEEKYASLVFHYREADQRQAGGAVEQLVRTLQPVLGNDLSLLDGKKVVEVLVKGVSKGQAAESWLKREHWGFIMAAGDDVTDESLFAVLPSGAYSFKIGVGQTAARYTIDSQSSFIGFLNRFSEK